MQRQQPEFKDLSMAQKAEATRTMLVLPALTVMVFLRRDLGYRMVTPRTLGSITMFLVILSLFVHSMTNSAKSYALLVFALMAFALGMQQRYKRWQELERGVKQHSFFLGTSPFRFHWLPLFFHRHRRIERFVDPSVCFLLGSVLLFFLPGLGFWLAAAGAGLRVYEDDVYQKEHNRNLDMIDGLIISENQSMVVEKFEEAPHEPEIQLNASVPTGLADDIQERLNRRKAKQSEPPKGA